MTHISKPGAGDWIVAGAFVVVYFLWTRYYARVVEPRLREALGRRLGVSIRWEQHHGSELIGGGSDSPDKTWGWDAGPDASSLARITVWAADFSVLLVFELGPYALFIGAFFLRLVNPIAGIVGLVLALPVFLNCLRERKRKYRRGF